MATSPFDLRLLGGFALFRDAQPIHLQPQPRRIVAYLALCCGEPRDMETTATLQCHDDIRVCRVCIGWLAQQAGMLEVTPTLPVVDMNKAVGFYEAAGFVVRRYHDGFVFVHHDEQSVFDLGLEENIDPQRNGAGCYIIVADVDEWHARFTNADLNATAVETKPWGMREFTTVDPSGNHIRIGTST